MAVSSANRSRTRLPDRTNLGEIVRATVDKHSTCACGQALDACHARCCPRCGVRIVASGSTPPLRRPLTRSAHTLRSADEWAAAPQRWALITDASWAVSARGWVHE